MSSSHGTLHIMNPETDFALGLGQKYYTPKASILELRRRMALLPSLWANPGDTILLLDKLNPDIYIKYHSLLESKKLTIITIDELKKLPTQKFNRVSPWGWNPSILHSLLQCEIDRAILPDSKVIEHLRKLAHRRNTINFHQHYRTPESLWPRELSDFDEVLMWVEEYPGGYLKAPWSSSGKGILRVKTPIDRWTLNRIKGILEKQETILAEPDWNQELDFATEWRLKDGKADFLGYSLFNVDHHNQYCGNVHQNQEQILNVLTEKGWKEDTHLFLQKSALEKIVGKQYDGPVGIDALYSPRWGFNLCVEINLRMTMGIVNLLKNNELNFSQIYK